MIKIRPFQSADWDQLLDLANQAVPFAPQENEVWLAYRRSFDESKHFRRHYIATNNEIPVGYSCVEQQSDDPKWLRIFVVCSPENLKSGVGDSLFDVLLKDARELEATHLWVRELLDDGPIQEFFMRRGFVESQRSTLSDQLPMVVFTLGLYG